ncbi:hypothetical protein GCM10009122_05720 [Fulvivirga kasyanovii]
MAYVKLSNSNTILITWCNARERHSKSFSSVKGLRLACDIEFERETVLNIPVMGRSWLEHWFCEAMILFIR